MQAPRETLAFALMLSPDLAQPDGLAVVDVNPTSKSYGKIVHQVIMPYKGDEFHHFGWQRSLKAGPSTRRVRRLYREMVLQLRHKTPKRRKTSFNLAI